MKNRQKYTPEYLLLAAIFGAHALSQIIPHKVESLPSKQIVRMRGIDDAIAYVKRTDSDTAITYGFVRKLIDKGELRSIRAGKKILINLDELLTYFNMGVKQYGDNS